MHLTLVSLPVVDVAGSAAYWSGTLGLGVTLEEGVARVRVGRNVLELRAAAAADVGPHHLAITVPTGSLGAAKAWLARRSPLLDRHGEDEFEGPPGWHSRSVYFGGPERAVLELIERQDLPPEGRWARSPGESGSFGPTDLVGLSEVGIVVPDVPATVARLEADAGLTPYAHPGAPSFAAVGDVHGLLVLVAPGRPWLPTQDRRAAVVPTTVEAVVGAAAPGVHALGGRSRLRVVG